MLALSKLFQVNSNYCMSCGMALHHKSVSRQFEIMSTKLSINLSHICHSCQKQLPWIEHIKCIKCGRAEACMDCARLDKRERDIVQVNRSAVTYSSLMRSWIRQFKYNGDYRLGYLMIEMMSLPIVQLLCGTEAADQVNTRPSKFGIIRPTSYRHARTFWHIVTSVPISRERLIERGFNQSEFLAKHLARQLQLPYVELLYRTSHAPRMSELGRTERLKTVKTLFSCQPAGLQQAQSIVQDKRTRIHATPIRILLIDDVYTTGATVRACAEVIKSCFCCEVEIYSITFARS